jgi:hypothetical protein
MYDKAEIDDALHVELGEIKDKAMNLWDSAEDDEDLLLQIQLDSSEDLVKHKKKKHHKKHKKHHEEKEDKDVP